MIGISQRDLARQTGIDYSYISKLENGTTPPPAEETILALSNNLKLDFIDLMFAAGKMPSVLTELILSDKEIQEYLRQKLRVKDTAHE